MDDKKCRICRRAGEKLFLKGEKCFTPKCVINKKPYAPGQSAASGRRRANITEYGRQLREKQKVRNTYGVQEKQFSNYVKYATSKSGVSPAEALYEKLESRLDNIVFRLGFALSRPLARQMVSHGHITVNGKRNTVPSYCVRSGDILSVREGSKNTKLFSDATPRIMKHKSPKWLDKSSDSFSGTMVAKPKINASEVAFDFTSVIEYYSR